MREQRSEEARESPYIPRSEPDGHPETLQASASQKYVVVVGGQSKADGQMGKSQQLRELGRADRKRDPGESHSSTGGWLAPRTQGEPTFRERARERSSIVHH